MFCEYAYRVTLWACLCQEQICSIPNENHPEMLLYSNLLVTAE